jgi:hypothetical protein
VHGAPLLFTQRAWAEPPTVAKLTVRAIIARTAKIVCRMGRPLFFRLSGGWI